MRIWYWVIATSLLLTLRANAQQSEDKSSPAAQTPDSAGFPNPASSSAQPELDPGNAPVATSPSTTRAPALSSTLDQAVDRAIEREHALIKMLKTRTPIVETYMQNLKFVPKVGAVPVEDHYFLGRMYMDERVDRTDYLAHETSVQARLLGGVKRLYHVRYQPLGFSWMVFADRTEFDREHYNFRYAHREFLGDVRCLVFAVSPKKNTLGRGRFVGRIWVEDQGYNIVRLNGTYEPRPRNAYFFHMDSWRLNLIPGYWVPAYVYSEEGDASHGTDELTFKAQTRLWGYDLQNAAQDSEFTQVLVDPAVKDNSPGAQDASPLEAQWLWQQQAGDNVIERLENGGLLAPAGEVNKVLETVINNVLTSNKMELPRPLRARVMLTTPLETFSAGSTIVLSRGLLDVLPDEASLAMVLSRELAHIILGHNVSTKYAFSDRMLFSDESTYQNLGFRHLPQEESEADQKALELLKNSVYAQELNTPGLFLREVAARAPALPALLTPHLGTGFTNQKGAVDRMVVLMNSAPALDSNQADQIAALPLGGRIKLNAWDDRLEMIKITPMPVTMARHKMPLEVAPFFPRLTRSAIVNPTATANATTAPPSN